MSDDFDDSLYSEEAMNDPDRPVHAAVLAFLLGGDAPGGPPPPATTAAGRLCRAAGVNDLVTLGGLLAGGADANGGLPLKLPGVDYHGERPLTPAQQFTGTAGHYEEYVPVNLTLRPLGPAVRNGHVEAVRALLDGGADPNADAGAGVPLLDAVREGHTAVVDLLLARGADPAAATTRFGTPVLQVAADQTNADVVKLLLAAGADPNAEDADGDNALRTAAWGGGPAVVAALLAGGAKVDPPPPAVDMTAKKPFGIGAKRWHGSPLATAAEKGDAEVVRLLIAAGADLSVTSSGGKTAYDIARKKNHAEVVRVLRDAGAAGPGTARPVDLFAAAAAGDVAGIAAALASGIAVDTIVGLPTVGGTALGALLQGFAGKKPDYAALMAAARAADEDPAERAARAQLQQIPREFMGMSALMLAAQHGHVDAVRALLAAGATVAASSTDVFNGGWTPLHFAAGKGHVEVMTVLLAAGADPGRSGGPVPVRPPLVCAIERDQLAAVRLLLERGANPNVTRTDPDLMTPIQEAACIKDPRVFAALVEAGARVPAADGDRRTVLHNAAANGMADLVRVLVDAGIDVNASYEKGTPLHAAAVALTVQNMHGMHDRMTAVVRELLAAGGDPNRLDGKGQTPLFDATVDPEVVGLLIAAGADVNVRGLDGTTALHWAAGRNKVGSVERLLAAGADVNVVERTQGWTPLDTAIDCDAADARAVLERAGGRRRP